MNINFKESSRQILDFSESNTNQGAILVIGDKRNLETYYLRFEGNIILLEDLIQADITTIKAIADSSNVESYKDYNLDVWKIEAIILCNPGHILIRYSFGRKDHAYRSSALGHYGIIRRGFPDSKYTHFAHLYNSYECQIVF